jgi:hypothetical protein
LDVEEIGQQMATHQEALLPDTMTPNAMRQAELRLELP